MDKRVLLIFFIVVALVHEAKTCKRLLKLTKSVSKTTKMFKSYSGKVVSKTTKESTVDRNVVEHSKEVVKMANKIANRGHRLKINQLCLFVAFVAGMIMLIR